ncbi:MAG TPA: hypothetical protein VJG65_02450 [Patescibacteria group bacterium]|nr:hypothetical protein [Patescibacteria group bacterium]
MICDFRQRRRLGFSLIDLLVAATIIIMISSFVLANFRAGQRANKLELVLKDITSGITMVRNFNFGGQLLVNGSFPQNGYGINFDLTKPNQYELFAVPQSGRETLTNGIKQFEDVDLISFYGLTADAVTAPPGGLGWEDAGGLMEIHFVSADEILGLPANNGSGQLFKFLGGIIEEPVSGRRAYFYVSLASGLVTGDNL